MEQWPEIDWEHSNVSHVLKHGFTPEEVENALGRSEWSVAEVPGRDGTTYLFYQTDSGRYAFSAVTRNEDGTLCVHTTREMDDTEKVRYKKMRKRRYVNDKSETDMEGAE